MFKKSILVIALLLSLFTRLNGLTTCPNCRMNINDAGDVKKIFPDSIIIDQSKEMVFANSEIDKLKTDLKVIKKLLSTERGKTTKLTSKVEKLSNQLASQKMTRHFKESGFNKHKFKVSDAFFSIFPTQFFETYFVNLIMTENQR